MEIAHFQIHLNKLKNKKNINYKVSSPASLIDFTTVEVRLGIKIPTAVKIFYSNHNGFIIEEPHLDVLSLDKIYFSNNSNLVFSIFNHKAKLCFDTSKLNEADQWDIINDETGYLVTHSMASFWSNKVWAWVDRKRAVWNNEY